MADHAGAPSSSGRETSKPLDAARGIAALAIATLHTLGVGGGALPSGWTGVLATTLEGGLAVFFVLSGYLIAGPFVRALVDGEPYPALTAYAVRRVLRIGPGYWVAFAATALAISALTPATTGGGWASPHLMGGDWLAGALMLQIWVPSQSAEAVLPVMWTLSVEAIFYSTVPLVAGLARRRLRGRRLDPARLAAGVCAAWVATALLQSRLGALPTIPHVSTTVEYLMVFHLSMLSVFCPGVLLALARTRAAGVQWSRLLDPLRSPRVRAFAPLATIGFLGIALAVYRASGGDLGLTPAGEVRRQPMAVAAWIAVAAALAADSSAFRRWVRILAPLGTISYGIYLYHWVVLRELVDRHVVPLPVPGIWTVPAKLAIALCLTLALACASYFVIERPAQRAGRRWTGPSGLVVHPPHRETVGVREPQKRASAVLRGVAGGEALGVTHRGRLGGVQSPPSAGTGTGALRRAGWVRPGRRSVAPLPPPVAAGEAVDSVLDDLRSET